MVVIDIDTFDNEDGISCTIDIDMTMDTYIVIIHTIDMKNIRIRSISRY